MRVILYLTLTVAFTIEAFALKSIKTNVYVLKTPGDHDPPNCEYITTILESGNGNGESKTTKAYSAINSYWGDYNDGLGMMIAYATFSGAELPTKMTVRVIEEDPGNGDDGVCHISVEAPFSKTPTIIRCIREDHNTLEVSTIINVRIMEVDN